MDLFRGLGKAGTGILGGVVQGAGKTIETVGGVAGSTPIVGGVADNVIGGTGKAIEVVGEATENFGDNLFGKKEDKKKTDEASGDQEEEEDDDYLLSFFDNSQVFVSLDGDDDRAYYDDTLEDLKAYDAEQARLKGEAADGGEKMNEE